MFKPPKTILFATNLSESCLPALLFATSLSGKYQAKLILFHVLEPTATSIEERLNWMLGARYKWMFAKENYQEIISRREDDARRQLIGKKTNPVLIRNALEQFGSHSGLNKEPNDWNPSQIDIAVAKGDVVEQIIKKAKNSSCDLIVMGARGGFLVDTAIGDTIKSVVRLSKISVLIVPPAKP